MKKLYKIMLAALFIFSCFVPLSVSAQESSTFEITNGNTLVFNGSMTQEQYETIILGSPYDLSRTLGAYRTNTNIAYFIYSADSIGSNGTLNNANYYSYNLNYSSWNSGTTNFSLSGDNTQIYFNSLPYISGSESILNWTGRTYKQFVSLFDDSSSLGWDADFNETLSNPYIAQLVGIAKEYSIDSWYIDFTIKRTPNSAYGYTLVTPGYQYSFSLYDSSSNFLESIIYYEVPGQECSTSNSSCRPVTSYTASVENITILKSSWLDVPDSGPLEVVDSSGNELIEYGNFSSQYASNSMDSVTNSFNSSASQYETFESQFNSNLTSSLDNIDVNSINLVNSNDFVKTASWVKVQFDDILDNSGIYKTAISFVLIIGLALLLLGRRL